MLREARTKHDKIKLSVSSYKQKEIEGNYIPPMSGVKGRLELSMIKLSL